MLYIIVYDLKHSQPNKNDGNGDIVIAGSSLFGPREDAGAGSSGERESVIGQLCPA